MVINQPFRWCKICKLSRYGYCQSQNALMLGIHADLVILQPLNQIRLSRSIYKVTSYVRLAPYQNPFKKFETYLTNMTTDLNSPYVHAHFYDLDRSHIIWGIFNLHQYPNYHNSSDTYNCRLSWQCEKMQEDVVIDHFDCHLNMHTNAN